MLNMLLLSGNEEKPVDGGQHLSPEPSPDDFSSPNPDQAAPLLQAQQRPPSRAEREETQPGSQSGAKKTDADVTETATVREGAENDDLVIGKEEIEEESTLEKDLEDDGAKGAGEREEEKDEDDADEGLPLSRGSDVENEEESEGQKEPPDANNNSLDTPQDGQDELLDVPELPAQVSLNHYSALLELFMSHVLEQRPEYPSLSQTDGGEETYCSDEIEVVLVDNLGTGSASACLDDSDSVKIIITMSCDPQTAAQLEESVKQSLLENAQVGNAGELEFKKPCV